MLAGPSYAAIFLFFFNSRVGHVSPVVFEQDDFQIGSSST